MIEPNWSGDNGGYMERNSYIFELKIFVCHKKDI